MNVFIDDALLVVCQLESGKGPPPPDTQLVREVLAAVHPSWRETGITRTLTGVLIPDILAPATLSSMADKATRMPARQNLARLFLHELERRSQRPGLGSVTPLKSPPELKLKRLLESVSSSSDGSAAVSVNAKCASEQTDAMPVTVCGTATFTITFAELQLLQSTYRFVTEEHMPKSFFSAVQFLLMSQEWHEYNCAHQMFPFGVTLSEDPLLSSLKAQAEALSSSDFDVLIAAKAAWDDTTTDRSLRDSPLAVELSCAKSENERRRKYASSRSCAEQHSRRLDVAKVLAEEQNRAEDCLGYSSSGAAEFQKALSSSLSELSTRCSWSIKTYFLGGEPEAPTPSSCFNVLIPKSREPVVVVFGRLTDFRSLEEATQVRGGRGGSTGSSVVALFRFLCHHWHGWGLQQKVGNHAVDPIPAHFSSDDAKRRSARCHEHCLSAYDRRQLKSLLGPGRP